MTTRAFRPFAPLLAVAALVPAPRPARACGCLAPPDPAHPVVQAGERIVFAMDANRVTAHIQIRFSGDAKEFGWLLPLPSLPTLELGSDELFDQLLRRTQPDFSMARSYPNEDCFKNAPPWDGGDDAGEYAEDAGVFGADDLGAAPGDLGGPPSPLVIEDSIGPFDYAVLRADDKKEMLGWLANNHYFVPIGTDGVVAPYIHKGAYFLALKLRAGQTAGDLQPVVVRYASDLPMIPITLTSVTAAPNMGIQVWVLGSARAIPRNYYHVVVNDAAIDWTNAEGSYGNLITRAVRETAGHHAFVTDHAGPSNVMQGALDWPGRFGDLADLRKITDAVEYTEYLSAHGYPFSGNLISILQRFIPVPQNAQVPNAATYYFNLRIFAFRFGPPGKYDANALTNEIDTKVVQPIRATQKLFVDHTYLTELYTTLSPEEMNRDPVFSFNPTLPDVSRSHEATLQVHCNAGLTGYDDQATLETPSGFRLRYPLWGSPTLPPMPAALRIELLREAGPPIVVRDNGEEIGKIASATLVTRSMPDQTTPDGPGDPADSSHGGLPGDPDPAAKPPVAKDPAAGADTGDGCSVGARRGGPGAPFGGLLLLAVAALFVTRGARRRG